jgi:Rap1a immunity proteins
MKRFAFVALFALVVISSRSKAEESHLDHSTGADLLRQCQMVTRTEWDKNQLGAAAFCSGYLSGLRDTFDSMRQYGHSAPACVPNNVTLKELAMVVIQYLNTYPTNLHEPYNKAALLALKGAYPCS